MRRGNILSAILVLMACGRAPESRSESPPVSPDVVQFLLASAASDFRTHGPSGPLRFRDVRVGRVTPATGEYHYMLCGQFRPAQGTGTVEWTPFVTIKTSGYEQYIGAQADAAYCQHPGVTWDRTDDMSSSLQRQVDSLGQGAP